MCVKYNAQKAAWTCSDQHHTPTDPISLFFAKGKWRLEGGFLAERYAYKGFNEDNRCERV